MADSGLTIGRFKELLLTYGSDFARWPAEDAASARLLITHSTEAQAAYQEADSLDTLFNKGKDSKAPADLLDKIMDAVDREKN